jgi:uncharacterized protein YecT (DUF1311 family)
MMLVICSGFFSQAIVAQTTKPNCESSQLTMSEMTHCSDDRLSELEADLQREYKQVLTSAANDPKLVQALKSSENAWIAYREKLVSVAFPTSGPHAEHGSALIVEKNELISDLTIEHIKHLRYLRHIYSGQ